MKLNIVPPFSFSVEKYILFLHDTRGINNAGAQYTKQLAGWEEVKLRVIPLYRATILEL